MITFSQLTAASAAHAIAPLSDLLQACVADGASVGFTDAGDRQVIERFWQARAAALADESHILLVAWQDQIPVATVTLSGSPMPNGYHRAEISKLLVHPQRRRQGIARQLMLQAEDLARAQKKTLLVLDTRSGDVASQLYLSLGWQSAGEIPHYACSTEGVMEAITLMYKLL